MIIKIQSDDGQDFAIRCGEQRGCVEIAVWNCLKGQTDLEHFTIEEVEAIIAALKFAVKVAKDERDYMENNHGN